MAVSVTTGLGDTSSPLAADLKVSMDTQVGMLDTNTTQFTTLLMKVPASYAKSFKEEWMEDQYLPTSTALAASATSADTTVTVTTGEGVYGQIGDIIMFVESGERARITSTFTSAWSVTRAIGTVTAASAASGTTLGGILIISNTQQQGSTLPVALVTTKTATYNYAQIIRNAIRFTGTELWTGYYSGSQLEYQRRKTGIEHKRRIEQTLFFGARSYTATSPPRGSAGGLDHYVTTNVTNVAGTFDKGELQDFLRSGLEYGNPERKVLFAAPIVAQVCSEFLQDNWVHARPDDNIFGVKVDFVISGVTGSKIPVFVKNSWKRAGEGTGNHIGSSAYLVDMEDVELLRAPSTDAGNGPRFTALWQKQQAPDADEEAESWFSEFTFKVKNERHHSILRGATG